LDDVLNFTKFSRFTLNHEQNNYIIERIFIQKKNRQQEKAKLSSLKYYHDYKFWNILLVNIFNKDRLKTKHRQNYGSLSYFMKYFHGDVQVNLMNTNQIVILLLYYTKFLVKNAEHLDDSSKLMFLIWKINIFLNFFFEFITAIPITLIKPN
jgi:hypothetical protein